MLVIFSTVHRCWPGIPTGFTNSIPADQNVMSTGQELEGGMTEDIFLANGYGQVFDDDLFWILDTAY